MTKPIITIHNATTDEITTREMNAAEFAQYKVDVETNNARLAEAEAKATQKAALLDRLGITAEEAHLLLS
jgi:hypothetical protein